MNLRRVVGRLRPGNSSNDENGGASGPNALDLLKADHEAVSALFERVLGEDTDGREKRSLTAEIVRALELHTAMEEQIFYPALRAEGGEDENDTVLEAYEEHGTVKDLIAKVRGMSPREETFKAKMTVMKELVQHHVEEEEHEMFDEARRTLGDERLNELGAEMQAFKESGGRGRRGARASGGRKTAGRKTAGRKSTGRKTNARGAAGRTPAAAAGGRKTAARKSNTGRKTAARKTAGRKAAGGTNGRRKSGGRKRS